jgi:colanic acid biosynthesis glycosyl transferase WcaI
MRVVFLNRFFFPDHAPTSVLLSDLAFASKQLPIEVTVIASRLHYDSSVSRFPKKENIEGVEIHRVWSSRRGRSGLLGRSLDYGSFYVSAAWRLWRIARPTDIIVAKTDPPLISVVVTIIAKLRGARTINWLQDIFPEVAEALNVGGRAGSLAFRLMKPLRNWSLQAATINIVVGSTMAAYLEGLGKSPVRTRVISNWTDERLITPIPFTENALRKEWGLAHSFVVGYAGNLGRAHEVDTIIEAMTFLHEQTADLSSVGERPRIVFLFIGGGEKLAKLEKEVSRRRLPNVQIRPYQSRDRLPEVLGTANVHLVSLNPELEGLIVPSKFYGIAAAGRATLFIGAPDGEIARLIDEHACGFSISPGDGKCLAFKILELARDPSHCAKMGERARTAFEKNWTKSRAIDDWQEVLRIATRARLA